MKTCLIYGHNGLDLDVALNLRAFYKKLGYWTIFTDKLFNSSLLVILRAVDKPIEKIENFDFQQIHVYDYGGWGYDTCIKSLDYRKTYIFTTSYKCQIHLVDNLNFPKNQIYIAFPPVETKLWIEKERKIKYNIVHIGNCKHKVTNDLYQSRFDSVINNVHVEIWGNNWDKKKIKSNGASGLFAVSKIYACSNYSLGIMVPFQRESTFSGRFWHATLNGCYLISEPGYYTSVIPGILETNYKIDDLNRILQTELNRVTLKEKSKKFWQEEYEKVFNIIKNKATISESYINLKVVLFIIFTVENLMKINYQIIKSKFTKY